MANEQRVPKVISFSPSADCELGRWVLLYHGIDYVEKRHAPPFFFLINKLYGGSIGAICCRLRRFAYVK